MNSPRNDERMTREEGLLFIMHSTLNALLYIQQTTDARIEGPIFQLQTAIKAMPADMRERVATQVLPVGTIERLVGWSLRRQRGPAMPQPAADDADEMAPLPLADQLLSVIYDARHALSRYWRSRDDQQLVSLGEQLDAALDGATPEQLAAAKANSATELIKQMEREGVFRPEEEAPDGLCHRCARVLDRAAKTTSGGAVCRFCRSELERRCWWCGAPGDAWPPPDGRFAARLDVRLCDKHEREFSALPGLIRRAEP